MSEALERWLEAALRHAPRGRRTRLAHEIRSHYADAVAAHRARGLAPQLAEQRALAELGDPADTARALRQSAPTLPIFGGARPSRWVMLRAPQLLLALLGAIAALQIARIFGADTRDMGLPTALALVIQITILALAIGIPLLFDDLDLSSGVVVMLGALVVHLPSALSIVSPSATLPVGQALPIALALGAGFGLLNGGLATLLRRPVALVTLITGGALAATLGLFPRMGQLGLASEQRTVVLTPTLGLLAIAALLLIAAALLTSRRGAAAPGPFAALTLRDRARTWASLALLAVPLVIMFAMINATFGGALWAWLAALTALIMLAVGSALLPQVSDTPEQRSRRARRQTRVIQVMAPLICVTILMLAIARQAVSLSALRPEHILEIALVAVSGLAGLMIVAGAFTTHLAAIYAGPAHVWLTSRIDRRQVIRVGALMSTSTIAACVGVLASAQGMRDNTYVLCASFFVLVPIMGLLVGGQHILRGWLRPAGALIGGLAIAATCTPLGGDNLAPSAAMAVLLTTLVVLGWWGAAKGQQQALSQQRIEQEQDEAASLWRAVRG